VTAAPSGGLYPVSYAYNQNVVQGIGASAYTTGGLVNLSKFNAPVLTVLFTEVTLNGGVVDLTGGELKASTDAQSHSPVTDGLMGDSVGEGGGNAATICSTGPWEPQANHCSL